jgi:hypothetical protein
LGAALLPILITNQANGLTQLLNRARARLLADDKASALKASD